MPRKQYVNMPPVKDEYGRFVKVKARIRETKPGESEGMLVYFFIEPDGANVPPEQLSLAQRNGGFCFDPPHRELVVVSDKTALTFAYISIGGGDKFKFKVGRKFDKSGAVDANIDVEVWRKIYVRTGKMKVGANPPHPWTDALVANMGTVKGSLATHFIEMESSGPHAVKHAPFVRGQGPLDEMEKARGKMKYPDQSTPLVFVDRIGKKSLVTWGPWEFSKAKLQGSLEYEKELPADQYTWPDDWHWGSCLIEVLDTAGGVKRVMRMPSGFMTKDRTGAFRHAEGYASRKVKWNFGTLPGMGAWLRHGSGSVRLTATIGIIDDTAMGSAWPSPPRILVATRHPITYKKSTTLENTVIHELGHVLGLNVKNLPKYDVAGGYLTGWETNGTWYNDVNGGRGPHCKTGATLDAKNIYRNGTCTMLHYVTGVNDFCADCGKALKRANLKRIGRTNVWPKG